MSPAPHPRLGRVLIRLVRILAPLVDKVGLAFADATNVGDADDYRVPDAVVYPPALSPRPRTWPAPRWSSKSCRPAVQPSAKFAFYRARGVREILVVDGDSESATPYDLASDEPTAVSRSAVLDVDSDLGSLWR